MPKPKRIWTCCICGKQETWRDGWQWYGSWKDLDDSRNPPAMCSDAGAEAHREREKLPPRSMGPMSPKAIEKWRAAQYKNG